MHTFNQRNALQRRATSSVYFLPEIQYIKLREASSREGTFPFFLPYFNLTLFKIHLQPPSSETKLKANLLSGPSLHIIAYYFQKLQRLCSAREHNATRAERRRYNGNVIIKLEDSKNVFNEELETGRVSSRKRRVLYDMR